MENKPEKPIGHKIIRLDQTTSTNTLIMDTPEYLDNHGLVIVADHQTAGKGRIGRKWASIPGAQLQFSVVVHPTLPKEQIPVMSLLVGVVVAETLEEKLGLKPTLKWPNDVLLDGRKVCGILLELKTLRPKEPLLAIGIGLNCLGSPEDFPPELQDILTTLQANTSAQVDREEILTSLLARMETEYQELVEGGKAALLERWRARANFSNQQVRFPTSKGPQVGVVEGVSEDGFLLVKTDEGEGWALSSGELEWL